MREVTERAWAKLNLTLDILRRRPDGYHDLKMVMQSTTLHDTVRVRVETGDHIAVRSSLSGLPEGEENLAGKAARAFFSAAGQSADVAISIEKRIPVCAGMAGGSSDAAAVLRALRALLCPTMSGEELERIGGTVGSDVPYCVRGGTVLAEGRGERLTTLPALPECFAVICKPDFGISTPELFARVRVNELTGRPETEQLVNCLRRSDLSGVAACVKNVFEQVLTEEQGKTIFSIQRTLLQNGALCAAMTGSGPTVFGLFQKGETAQTAYDALKNEYLQTFLEKTR